ncbi:erythromycin esterase family protein, partial [Actinomadura welshii]
LRTVDPRAPLTDLGPLRRSVGHAAIAGLGESTHGAAEEIALKHRTLRFLVEELGFRSVAWEADWTVGVQIDDYLRTGEGDPDALVRQMATTWRSREVAAVLRWLREWNAAHPSDQVRFTGVEFFATGRPAYDAVTEYVARVAPRRLADLREHLRPLEPRTPDIGQWAYEYSELDTAEQKTYIDNARAVYDLVRALPRRRAHAITLQHARQIVSFYEYFAMERGTREMNEYRDSRAARNLRWWRRHSGDKTVYWAATAHTADAPDVTISAPPEGDTRFDSVGSYLRRWYGRRYLSVGFTFDHGT